ncbi:MAG: reprolysin-like metallopeptidase [Planctomycetota bacterium]
MASKARVSIIIHISMILQAGAAFGRSYVPYSLKHGHVAADVISMPRSHRMVDIELATIDELLGSLGPSFQKGSGVTIITLPDPEGGEQDFVASYSPSVHSELESKYPYVRSYRLRGIDDAAAAGRITVSPGGVNGLVLTPEGSWCIDRRVTGERNSVLNQVPVMLHSVYGVSDTEHVPVTCGREQNQAVTPQGLPGSVGTVEAADGQGNISPQVFGDSNLVTLRAAIATTQAFAEGAAGEPVTSTNAAQVFQAAHIELVELVDAANAITEVELDYQLEIVPQNDAFIYVNEQSSPLSEASISSGNLAPYFEQLLLPSDYDIGHLVRYLPVPSAAGEANDIGAVCTIAKAAATTRTGTSFPDNVQVFAHEVGHQLGARHTWNGASCPVMQGWAPRVAFEPGQGSTIMGYPNSEIIGSGDLLPQLDSGGALLQFNIGARRQIQNYLFGERFNDLGSGCGGLTPTGNSPPTFVSLPPSFRVIPVGTPFELAAEASDADGDTVLYSWEQQNTGLFAPVTGPDDGRKPLFQVLKYQTSGTRVFPREPVLAGIEFDVGERLPQLPRAMRFAINARDGRGGNSEEVIHIAVSDSIGPFMVSDINSDSILDTGAGQVLHLHWDPAGTNKSIPPAVEGITQADLQSVNFGNLLDDGVIGIDDLPDDLLGDFEDNFIDITIQQYVDFLDGNLQQAIDNIGGQAVFAAAFPGKAIDPIPESFLFDVPDEDLDQVTLLDIFPSGSFQGLSLFEPPSSPFVESTPLISGTLKDFKGDGTIDAIRVLIGDTALNDLFGGFRSRQPGSCRLRKLMFRFRSTEV